MANLLVWSSLRTSNPLSALVRPSHSVRTHLSSTKSRAGTRFLSSAHPHANDNPTTSQSKKLSGRKCLITGGTSGIGVAIAKEFLQEGASTVVLVGRSRERLEAAARTLQSSTDADRTTGTGHGPMASSNKVNLLVGDVGEAGSWMRELEKEMVGHSLPS